MSQNRVATGSSSSINKSIPFSFHFLNRVLRGVFPMGAGGAMAPPDFGRSVNPISTTGGRLCPPNSTGTPGFSDLSTALRTTRFFANVFWGGGRRVGRSEEGENHVGNLSFDRLKYMAFFSQKRLCRRSSMLLLQCSRHTVVESFFKNPN